MAVSAKKINVSDDNGVNWFTLPGGDGSLRSEAGDIPDTIFGQNYRSSEVGLINWQIQAQAFYKGFAGYVADIKEPGTPVTTTGEACTLVSGKTYQINDTTKRVWDRTATIVVYDNAVDHTADVASIDYLFGRVTFDASYTVTGSVTVDVDYIPMAAVASAQTYNLTQTMEPTDNSDLATVQANGGYRTFTSGLQTVNLELGNIFNLSSDWIRTLDSRSELIIEINPDGNLKSIARGFFKLGNQNLSGAVGALEEETLTFRLNVPYLNNPGLDFPFGWEHANDTTLSQAMQILLTSWLNGTEIDAQYLPDGVSGYEGGILVGEVSMQGGINGMNEFSTTLQGTGALIDEP